MGTGGNEIKQYKDDGTMKKPITIQVTSRLVFYIVYLMVTIYLCTVAIVKYYSIGVSILVWFLLIMSYPFSIFLISRKEE